MQETAKELLEFIKKSPTAFHAAATVGKQLTENGYEKLDERDRWNLQPGKKYYVTRNDSSVIAFRMPQQEFLGYQVMASHSDSPSFKLKDQPELIVEGHYIKLNVEKYGGMLMTPWFDRPLSVAGRVMVKTEKGIETRLVNIDKDLLMIPSLAIHMNREVNDGYKLNAQKDMLPLFACGQETGTFTKLVSEAAGADPENLLSSDLFLYIRSEGCVWGGEDEFVSCGQLDDLQCAFAGLKGFLAAEGAEKPMVPVYALLDNEEVGSGTKQGAASTFLKDVLVRINKAADRDEEDYIRALAGSFMVSADNAHAVHPNYADKTDPTNRPYVNEGIVIKHSANQKYTTDAVSDAVYRLICAKAGVPVQSFYNRSDMLGGSTLGNIANTQTPMNTVDIGLPQLAMHSPYETAGVKDTWYLVEATKEFYSCCVAEMM